MTRTVVILGTVHQIQGAEKFSCKIEDPFYLQLVNQRLDGIDFLFEEASGLGPTAAQQSIERQLGTGHYLDIDPHMDTRSEHGIGITGDQFPIHRDAQFTDSFRRQYDIEQSKREELWVRRVSETDFGIALLICGYLHTLSLAYKLRLAGFSVETWTYVPYLRLCPRPHMLPGSASTS